MSCRMLIFCVHPSPRRKGSTPRSPFPSCSARKDWVDVNETILEVVALARSEVQSNGVSLRSRLAEDLPLILGDRIQLQQVLLNLIINAIEAMNEVSDAPRELFIASAKDDSQGVLVAVRDSGPGLDLGGLDRLFHAFYTTKPQGMGMGLAISRSIVEAHGDRKSTRLNSSHSQISYAVFCLKKKKTVHAADHMLT